MLVTHCCMWMNVYNNNLLILIPLCWNYCLVISSHLNLQGPSGKNPKTLNGLLSPHLEQPVPHSQTSLCEMLHEKKWAAGISGTGTMDHSALIPLRSKNFRERSDAHFVDVIKEDRLESAAVLRSCGDGVRWDRNVREDGMLLFNVCQRRLFCSHRGAWCTLM